jgi:MoaA/NifB/PqqE/SkfB family radical SAM enzyme
MQKRSATIRKVVPTKLAASIRKNVLHRRPKLFHLEVHLTDHCNLKCKGCGHFSCLADPYFADLDEFKRDFARLAELVDDFERIHLLGGEPLLHPQVAEFVRVARQYFPNTRLVLYTNGLLLAKMNEEFWQAMHDTRCVLFIDKYPVNLPVDQIKALIEKYDVDAVWEERVDFYKLPIHPEGGFDAEDSFRRCHDIYNCPILRNGRIYPCAYAAYADILEDKMGVKGIQPTEKDSISIYDENDPFAIAEFLMRPIPWCSRCDANSRVDYEWAPTKRDPAEWMG